MSVHYVLWRIDWAFRFSDHHQLFLRQILGDSTQWVKSKSSEAFPLISKATMGNCARHTDLGNSRASSWVGIQAWKTKLASGAYSNRSWDDYLHSLELRRRFPRKTQIWRWVNKAIEQNQFTSKKCISLESGEGHAWRIRKEHEI